MKYQILGDGWPVGQHLIPASTIIDTDANDHWSNLVRGLRPPLDAMPLTKETWLWMKKLYPGLSHEIVTPAGAER